MQMRGCAEGGYRAAGVRTLWEGVHAEEAGGGVYGVERGGVSGALSVSEGGVRCAAQISKGEGDPFGFALLRQGFGVLRSGQAPPPLRMPHPQQRWIVQLGLAERRRRAAQVGNLRHQIEWRAWECPPYSTEVGK